LNHPPLTPPLKGGEIRKEPPLRGGKIMKEYLIKKREIIDGSHRKP
jgi:hypothetical protein